MEIQLWKELLDPYELAVNEVVVKFDHLIKEHRQRGIYSPIEQVTGRVKSIPSLIEKVNKKKIALENVEEEIEDIAGIRIICQFVEDIATVVELIKKRTDMEVKKEKDYISTPKKSGYRSYHMIIYYTIDTLKGPKKINMEIQVRTLAMNFWSTIEHSLQYKYKRNMPDELKKKLTQAAAAIIDLDSQMSYVRSEIMEAQNFFQTKSNIVSEILNNIQNLYRVANKREVEKMQNEFYKIYQMNDMEKLEMFNKHLDVIAEGYRAQAITISGIEETYKNKIG